MQLSQRTTATAEMSGISESNSSPYLSHPSILADSSSKLSSPFSDLLEETCSDAKELSYYEEEPPILSSVEDPIVISSDGELRTILDVISGSLAIKDPEAWDKRMEALATLERIVAGRSIRKFHEAVGPPQSWIISFFRKIPMEEQLEDLRSIITGQACKVVAALAYELRNDFAPLAEKWISSILHLSISGVRVMAQQGMNCIMQITAFPGVGYPRTLALFLDGCTGKHHPNYKRSCVMALTNALRMWSCESILEKSLRAISKAVMSAATDRDPQVREHGRKAFWALYDRFEANATEILSLVDSSSRKHLQNVRKEATLDWEEGGPMNLLSRGFEPRTITQTHQSNSTSNAQGCNRFGGGAKKSTLHNGSRVRKPVIQSVSNLSQDISVIGTSLKSNSTSRSKLPISAAKVGRSRVYTPDSNLDLTLAVPSTPQMISTKTRERGLDVQGHLSMTTNSVIAATPERKSPELHEFFKEADQSNTTDFLEHSVEENDAVVETTYTIQVFLDAVSDPDWSVRENSLSLLAVTFSASGESIGQKFDLDSFIYADHEMQHSLALALARSIDDLNLCVSMSSLEAIHSILLHAFGQKILYNFMNVMLSPLLNKQFVDMEGTSDRLVDDCLVALQGCASTPSSLKPVMVAVLELFNAENFEQLSPGAQFRLYHLLCHLVAHAHEFLENQDNLRSTVDACVFFACKTSPFSICEKVKPLIDSLSQAVDSYRIFRELANAKSEEFVTAIRKCDADWAREVIEINEGKMADANRSFQSYTEDDTNLEKMPVEMIDCTPLKRCLSERSNVDENHCLKSDTQIVVHHSSLRTPLAKVNRNSSVVELNKSRLQTPDSDPVLRYMTRPSPISAIKFCKETIHSEMKLLLTQLRKYEISPELYIAMQCLLQLARDQEHSLVWDEYFVEFFETLVKGVNEFTPSSIISDDATEARHLYLQGLRVLLKFHSHRFNDLIDLLVRNMMICCNDVNSHIVHAAERVLESLVMTQEPCSCFHSIRPFIDISPGNGLVSSNVALSGLRTMIKLAPRLDKAFWKDLLPTLFPSLLRTIIHDSVDIRKATVFLLVEVVVTVDEGDLTLFLDQLTLAQRRLVSYYVDQRQGNCIKEV